MNAPVSNKDGVEVTMLPNDHEAIVAERLRVLLGLAISIGRREGLLDTPIKDNANPQTGHC
jgi:hypothetical protein